MDAKILRKMPLFVNYWLLAVRLRTLPIPTVPVLAGSALAMKMQGTIDWPIVLWTWLISIFVTIGTNVINDALDYEKGGDPHNRFGHKKVIREGFLTQNQVFNGGLLFFCLALLCSLPLVFISGGWGIFYLTCCSICAGYCYTGGPLPISYIGASEFFVVLFYGCICVLAPFYLQTGEWNAQAILLSLQIGFLAIMPNVLNNFRDMFEDQKIGKKTLAVRFGKYFARLEVLAFTILPFILNLFWFAYDDVAAGLLPLLITPLAFLFVRSVWKADPGPVFNRYFALCIVIYLLFGSLLIAGLLID